MNLDLRAAFRRFSVGYRSVVPAQERWLGKALQKSVLGLACLAGGLLALGYALVFLMPTSKIGYFLQYCVMGTNTATYDRVVISPRPHDCEWLTAPLGEKNCRYDAVVVNVRTDKTASGLPIVSYDDGKTWQENTQNEKAAVFVSWRRIED